MKSFSIVTLFLFLLLGNTSYSQNQPNVLFILADDLGVNALNCYGNTYVESPHIDQLAADGVRFTNGYANDPTCAPSRASIMTGQYAPRHKIYRVSDRHLQQPATISNMRYLPPENNRPDNKGVGLSLEQTTLAEAFQQSGYTTGGFGKWHLGKKNLAIEYHGFDQAIETTKHYQFSVHPPQEDILENEYNADYTTRKGIAFMQEAVKQQQPFFLYMPYYLVHKPLEPKAEILAHFKAKYEGQFDLETLQVLAMIKSLDESVGQLLAAVEEMGISEETIIVFASDNGHYSVKNNFFNQPYQGEKGNTYEGGIRVPYVFRWPGRIAAGRVETAPIIHVDLYPSLLKLAHLAPPEEQVIDGTDISPLLLSDTATLDRHALVWQYTNYSGYNAKRDDWRSKWVNVIQYDGYKMTEDVESGSYTLYNLTTDPYETTEIAEQSPEKLTELQLLLAQWKVQTKSETPRLNPAFKKDH